MRVMELLAAVAENVTVPQETLKLVPTETDTACKLESFRVVCRSDERTKQEYKSVETEINVFFLLSQNLTETKGVYSTYPKKVRYRMQMICCLPFLNTFYLL